MALQVHGLSCWLPTRTRNHRPGRGPPSLVRPRRCQVLCDSGRLSRGHGGISLSPARAPAWASLSRPARLLGNSLLHRKAMRGSNARRLRADCKRNYPVRLGGGFGRFTVIAQLGSCRAHAPSLKRRLQCRHLQTTAREIQRRRFRRLTAAHASWTPTVRRAVTRHCGQAHCLKSGLAEGGGGGRSFSVPSLIACRRTVGLVGAARFAQPHAEAETVIA